jgi:hypothetical protein
MASGTSCGAITGKSSESSISLVQVCDSAPVYFAYTETLLAVPIAKPHPGWVSFPDLGHTDNDCYPYGHGSRRDAMGGRQSIF